jgi:type IV pilus assembly protein PilY1
MNIKSTVFGLLSSCLLVMTMQGGIAWADVSIAQTPLYLGGGGVPGNLVLVPSVEWPTINGVANLADYSSNQEFAGYFDPYKCYGYSYSATESDRHFYPVSTTATRTCSGYWSGNFLNWATTQTIDPFRSALTGGYRVKDTTTETWLEKARHDGQGGTSIFPNRRLPASGDNASMLSGATPFNQNWMRMRIQDLGNKMRFRLLNDGVDTSVTAYNPANTVLTDRAYELSVRVKVCDPSVGVESNCRQYSSAWKPEGTIQQYSRNIRYSVFGYLNHSITQRDGGVLRAKAKFVGPTIPGGDVEADNPNKEWDPTTGVLVTNPDPTDATATTTAVGTTVSNSGVINYLNKFGQITTQDHKSYDPVSELYYSAIRYLKNLGNVPEYTNMSGTSTQKYNMADGFPVITSWTDPITNWCQSNVILGIGDVYTHRDKNLPGNTVTTDEPAVPALVTADTTVNVNTATQKVASLEGITINTPFTGRENSAYMAGLAYDSHTKDIRPDLTGGKVTVSTYWVDVCEEQSLEPIHRNQFYLTAKYGGFTVPEGFDTYAHATALPTAWWHTNTDTLTSFGSRGDGSTFPRPDNYFIASEANSMVQSLIQAFADITAKRVSSAAAIATNSTRLDADTFIYQARFDSGNWTGQLLAYAIDETDGSVGGVEWDAADKIPGHASRSIYTYNGTTGLAFTTTNFTTLSAAQQTALGSTDVLSYLRGNPAKEVKNTGGIYRNRDSLLGDIVNSDPWYVGRANFGYSILPEPEGTTYIDFISSAAVMNRTPMVYVGANDGMLHAFHGGKDADGGGTEKFAYIPQGVYSNLASLASPSYTHKYFVDGSPRAADVYVDRGAGDQWRTILVGTTGAGGRSVFALDVTDPDNFDDGDVMWEFGYADVACTAGVTSCREVGYAIGQPSIVRLADGKWGVIFGNGYNSANHMAHMFIVNAETGALIKMIETEEGSVASPNGMATPIVVDLNGDRIADRIYAGDLHGNMWRFDISETSGSYLSDWDSPFYTSPPGAKPAPLFKAVDPDGVAQAITAKPQVGSHPDGGYMVYFGTGKYFTTGDNTIPADPQINTFYGVRDNDSVVTRAELLPQSIIVEMSETFTNDDGSTFDWDIRVVSDEPITTQPGWRIDLVKPVDVQQGERVISAPLLWRDRVIFTTLIPDPDPCAFGGTGWIMELDPVDGSRLDFSVFDLNKDGSFTNGEYVEITLSDGTKKMVPVSGKKSKEGIIKTPGVVSADDTVYKYTSGSSGVIEVTENVGSGGAGRQSWQQLR